MARLPVVGGDEGNWGSVLLDFLAVGHNPDGTLKTGAFLSVRDFGAAGDGATDDTVAIQAAINAAGNNKAVFFPAGTYLISAPINLKPGGAYFGVGPASVIKQANGANQVYLVRWPDDGVTKKFCAMRDITIDGNRDNNTGVTTYGLYGHSVQWTELHNVRVQYVHGDGYRFDGATDGVFEHITSTLYFLDCWAYGNTNNGLVLTSGVGDVHIISGNYGFNGSSAMTLQSGSGNVTDATLWGTVSGPGLVIGGTDNQIRGCNIEGNAQQGIVVNQYADHTLIHNCKIYANSDSSSLTYDAIYVNGVSGDNVKGVTITGNRIYSNLFAGPRHRSAITFGTYHSNAIVSGNTVGFAGASGAWTPDAAGLIQGTNGGDIIGHNPGISDQAVAGDLTVGRLIMGDTVLYTPSADIIRADDALSVKRALATDPAYAALITGDTQNRYLVDASGKILWGPGGSTAGDTNLYRGAADTLRTDDALQIITNQAAAALLVQNAHASGNGISAIVGTATNYLLRSLSNADTQYRIIIDGNGKLTWGSGTAVGDVSLSRAAAGVLGLGGWLAVTGGAGSTPGLSTQITGDTGQRWVARSDGTLEWGPGNASRDTVLYRAAADSLATDDKFSILRSAAGSSLVITNPNATGDAMAITVASASRFLMLAGATADAQYRYRLSADGKQEWGDGTAAVDTNLYRSAADTLKTDDTFNAVGGFQVNGVGLGDWVAYSPAIGGTGWALGNAVVDARYSKIGKTINWCVSIVWGSTSTFGAGQMSVALPVTARAGAAYRYVGLATGLRVGVNDYHFRVEYSGTSVVPIMVAANGSATPVTGTAPVTWQSGDTWTFSGTYEAA